MSEKKVIPIKYHPDYVHTCTQCDATPVVVGLDDKGKIVKRFELCGVCLFGSAECLDPEEW